MPDVTRPHRIAQHTWEGVKEHGELPQAGFPPEQRRRVPNWYERKLFGKA